MSFDRKELERSKRENAMRQAADEDMQKLALSFVIDADRKYDYGYQWTWLGLPIIQLPADIVATGEIIWGTQPDVIIETGIAWGGSVVYYASLLELIGKGEVVAIDVVLPEKNRKEIMKYRFSKRIHLYEGSSSSEEILEQVKKHVGDDKTVMVLLDSNHTHEHVLDELRFYAPLVTKGQFLVVSDTIIEDLPVKEHRVRPWGPGRNPKTALREYLKETDRFEEDAYINNKLLTTYTPNGYLRCVK